MGDEVFEADPVLGVPLEEVVEQVGELGRGAAWHAGRQSSVPLVELLQSLRGKAVKPGSTSFTSSPEESGLGRAPCL